MAHCPVHLSVRETAQRVPDRFDRIPFQGFNSDLRRMMDVWALLTKAFEAIRI
jgi:hypothetical protein